MHQWRIQIGKQIGSRTASSLPVNKTSWMLWFTFPICVTSAPLFWFTFVLTKERAHQESHVGFPCKRMQCVWDWKPTFLGPNVRSHKTILFRAFQLPCDPSKPFLMQTLQKTVSQTPQNSPSLCFSSPSHYLICHCGNTINFHPCFSGAVLFSSVWSKHKKITVWMYWVRC